MECYKFPRGAYEENLLEIILNLDQKSMRYRLKIFSNFSSGDHFFCEVEAFGQFFG